MRIPWHRYDEKNFRWVVSSLELEPPRLKMVRVPYYWLVRESTEFRQNRTSVEKLKVSQWTRLRGPLRERCAAVAVKLQSLLRFCPENYEMRCKERATLMINSAHYRRTIRRIDLNNEIVLLTRFSTSLLQLPPPEAPENVVT